MVKIGEYFDYALQLESKMIDYNPAISLKNDEISVSTELAILLETAKKVNDLEKRIIELEKRG